MGRLLELPDGFSDYDFKTLMQQETKGRSRVRLLAMYHLQTGKTLQQVADAVQANYKTVQTWLRKVRIQGLRGLYEGSRSGAPMKLSDEAQQWLEDKIKHLSQAKTGGYITGNEILKMLNKHYNINCSLKTVYNYLHRLEFSWITSRSIHPNTSQEVQDAYKKTSVSF